MYVMGSIADRPWGWQLARLALRGDSGQLTIEASDKRYCIAFDRGRIVGASSPVAADSAARIALTGHAISTAQLAEVGRRLTAAPERDEIELVAEVAKLSLDHAEALRRRVISQRSARTFGLEQGTWSMTERPRIPIVPGISVDVYSIVYLGSRTYMTDDRLSADLRKLGTHFTLKPEAVDDLPAFGFTDLESPVIRALRGGASLPELEAIHRELDPRALQAIVYTLATCEALTCVTVARSPTPSNVLFRPRASSPQEPVLARTLSPQAQRPQLARTMSPQSERTPQRPVIARTKSPDMPVVSRTKSPTLPISARTPASPTNPPPGAAVARVKTGRMPTAPLSEKPLITRTPSRAVDPAKVEELAKQAFDRGEHALRSDQLDAAIPELEKAVELAPADVDYGATLAWAKFCRASDKQTAAAETRRALDRAVYKSGKPAQALFYLARMERIVGRDSHALRHFQEVLALQPSNQMVASEIRVLEARIARDSKR
jgi:hypothetical protein